MEVVSIHLRFAITWLTVLVLTYIVFRITHLIDNYSRCASKKLTWDCYKFYNSSFSLFYIILISYPLGEFVYFFIQFLIWLFPELQ